MQELPLNKSGWEALDLIKQKCPSAFIAGGALRDLELGLPISDVDVFIVITDRYKMSTSLGEWYESTTDYPTNEFYSLRLKADNNLNLIVLDSALEDLTTEQYICHHFDCGLSRIYMKLDDMVIRRHATYIRDVKEEAITWNPDPNPKYVEKMKEKFPRHTHYHMQRKARNDSRSWH